LVRLFTITVVAAAVAAALAPLIITAISQLLAQAFKCKKTRSKHSL
jgi:hypothetical protein